MIFNEFKNSIRSVEHQGLRTADRSKLILIQSELNKLVSNSLQMKGNFNSPKYVIPLSGIHWNMVGQRHENDDLDTKMSGTRMSM